MIVTRFAPSPTGELHLGGAWTAIASWMVARKNRGRFILRMEDLDTPRTVKGASVQILDDLYWLGLDWDEGPDVGGPCDSYEQSKRSDHYERALDLLQKQNLLYPCDCSRAEIARVASAPHEGEEWVYPGLCRDRDPKRTMKRPPALRVRVSDRIVHFVDDINGAQAERLAMQAGDFVLKRGDGVYAYQLAVVVDDAAMGITDVIRGEDLLSSTARQIFLFEALGKRAPRFAHLPLVVDHDGARLAKRSPSNTISGLRKAGVAPEVVVGKLAFELGLIDREIAALPRDLIAHMHSIQWRTSPYRAPFSDHFFGS